MLYPPVIALITLHTSINFQHTQEVQALSALLLVLYKFSPLNREQVNHVSGHLLPRAFFAAKYRDHAPAI